MNWFSFILYFEKTNITLGSKVNFNTAGTEIEKGSKTSLEIIINFCHRVISFMQQYYAYVATQYDMLIRRALFLLATKHLRTILYMSEALAPVFHQVYNLAFLHNDPHPLIRES